MIGEENEGKTNISAYVSYPDIYEKGLLITLCISGWYASDTDFSRPITGHEGIRDLS